MTSAQAKRWLSRLTISARVWCIVGPTTVILVLAGVLPAICIAAFIAATLGGLLILVSLAFLSAQQTRNRSVRATHTLRIDHGDDEMWRSLTLRRQDDTMFEPKAIGNSDEPLHHEVASHMSITVFDRNADGTPNFTGTGVFSSGTQDIEF